MKITTKNDVLSLSEGTHRVEDNLYIKVKDGRRYFYFVYTLNKKRVDMSLGSFTKVPLSIARTKAKAFRAMLAVGKDPRTERQKAKAALIEEESNKVEKVLTFSIFFPDALRQIEALKCWRNKKHAEQWYTTIKTYAVPVIGDKKLQDITTQDILEILKPIWSTKTETASRVRGRLETLFAFAIRHKLYIHANPAAWKHNLEYELPSVNKVQTVTHHASMPHEECREKIKLLWPTTSIQRALILFTTLSACRIGETAPAKWSEFDFKRNIWNCPPERRKDGKPYPHRVPLTDQMLNLLHSIRQKSEYVFAYGDSHVSKESPRVLLQKIFKTKATMHGMRSTFRDWCAETGVPDVLAEKALMHTTGNEVVQAYQRSDLLEQRRELMQRWSDYLLKD